MAFASTRLVVVIGVAIGLAALAGCTPGVYPPPDGPYRDSDDIVEPHDPAGPDGRPYPRGAEEPVDSLMRSLGFNADEIQRVRAGRASSRTLPTGDGREVAVAGVVRIGVAPGEFARQMSDIARFKKSDRVLQIGTFSRRPEMSDISALTLDPDDLHGLRRCRIGDCDLQLPRSIIERLQREVNWTSPAATQHAMDIFRAGLAHYVQEYRASGRQDGMVYADDSDPVDVAAEFRKLANADTHLLARYPELKGYLLDPSTRPGEITDVIYWSKEKVARTAVVNVTHLAISAQPSTSPIAYVAGSKQLYASRYFDSSLGLTIVMRDGSHPGSSYVAYVNRSRVDAFGGLFGGITRGIVRSRARGELADVLDRLQRRLAPNGNPPD